MRTADISSTAVPARTVSSGSALIEAAAAATKMLPAGWTQETFESPAGEVSLVVMSPDDAETTYLVTQSGAGFQLDLLISDELSLVGKCQSVGHLAWLIDARIRREAPVSRRAA